MRFMKAAFIFAPLLCTLVYAGPLRNPLIPYDPNKDAVSYGNGQVPSVNTANGRIFYFKDADMSNFDFFNTTGSPVVVNGVTFPSDPASPPYFHQYFPLITSQVNALSPPIPASDLAYAPWANVVPGAGAVGNMAYSPDATAAFHNVQVSTTGPHKISFRYAFAGGLFRNLQVRYQGLKVNGVIINPKIAFPRTSQSESDFSVFQEVTVDNVPLNGGGVKNEVVLYNVDPTGASLSRLDTMRIHTEGTP